VDSRVILDTPGAEKLLGHGDALYMAPDSPSLMRIQGCYVSDAELEGIVNFWRGQMPTRAEIERMEGIDPKKAVQKPLWPGVKVEIPDTDDADEDALLQQATDLVIDEGRASVSYLQRALRIGYTRASRLIDTLEERGIIGPATGTSKARDVLVSSDEDDASELSSAQVRDAAELGE
jgi:DNA segregation ATPase FtsK/SpoIIIE, S-DNA-T family